MNSNVVIGKYINVKSAMHNIDARVKLLSLILFIFLIFLHGGFSSYIYLTIFIFYTFLFSNVPFKILMQQLKNLLFLTLFLFILTILTTTADVSPSLGHFALFGHNFYYISIYNSIYIVWRIYLMITVTIVIISTTKPYYLTLAIESLLRPLKIFRLPIHEISIMISIALRFIPTFILESQIIFKAQISRGVDFKSGNIKRRLTSIISVIIPLFLSSFQKAEDLANAMDVRGYIPGAKRTKLNKLKIKWCDIVYIFLLLCIGTFIIFNYVTINNHHFWFFHFIKWKTNIFPTG